MFESVHLVLPSALREVPIEVSIYRKVKMTTNEIIMATEALKILSFVMIGMIVASLPFLMFLIALIIRKD